MLHYTSGGQFKVPVVIRGPGGVGRQLGAEHSQRLESYFQSIPGVQLVAVSTVANAKALLKSVSAAGACTARAAAHTAAECVVWGEHARAAAGVVLSGHALAAGGSSRHSAGCCGAAQLTGM
eukprot:GHRQ01039351.1.p3 GENE.GHRQ01039351.1~~GHRQ01039351.1.p3  ORF type:complete len:122 (-),score=52.61 GHRQ01039351.1:346-711(-)